MEKHVDTYPLIFRREKDEGQVNTINKGLDIARDDIV